MRAKPNLLARRCWEQDMAAREVLLWAATALVRILQKVCSSGLEQLEANTAEGPAWMLREGIQKRAVVSDAVFSPRPKYSCMGGTALEPAWQSREALASKEHSCRRMSQNLVKQVSLAVTVPGAVTALSELGLEQLRDCRPLCSARGASQFYSFGTDYSGGFKTCRC